MRDTKHITKSEDTTVTLRGVPVSLASDVGGAFLSDAARNKEKLFSDQRLIEKYGLTMDAWAEIAKNPAFRLAVDAEHERRVYNGDAAKEAAAKFFTKAPEVLDAILNDKSANARHRIEAAKELRATANVGAENSGKIAERFTIVIDLGADQKIKIDQPIAPMTSEEAKEAHDAD